MSNDERSSNSPGIWLDELREGIVIGMADPLRLAYANPAMAAMTGYTVEELTALPPEGCTDLIHPDDRDLFFRRFRQRLAGDVPPAEYDIRCIRKDGPVIWLTIHSSRIEFEGQPAVLAAFTNISTNKEAELALRESETKMKAQYKAIPVPTYTWQKKGEGIVLIDFNDIAYELTKGNIVNYVGITVREMYKDAPEIIHEMEQCLREKKPIERELEYSLRTTGETKNFAVKYAYVPPDLVLVHTEDITARTRAENQLRAHKEHLEERIEKRTAKLTELNERLKREIIERKRTETELRVSEARYRAVVEDQTEVICRFTPEYVMTFVNENYCRLFDAEPEELIGQSFMPRISKADQELVKSRIGALSSDNPVSMHDQRTILPNGDVIWQQWTNRAAFDETGRISEYQAVGRDITKRKEAEEELRESEARYRAIIEDQTEFVTRFKPDSTLTFINDAACRYFGMKREELIGKRFFPMIAPEDRAAVENAIARLSKEREVTTHDQRTIVPNGEAKWQAWTSRAIFDENGDIIEYQGVGRDITERKKAEEALERSNRELGVLNKINSIINSSISSKKILNDILETVAVFCNARFAGLFEIEYGKDIMQLVASYGLPKVVAKRVERVNIVGSVMNVLESRKVLVLEEDIPAQQSNIYKAMKGILGFKKVIGFGSRSQEKVQFIVYLGTKQEEKFGDHERNFLEVIGDQLGIALERFMLLKELGKSKKELKKLTSSLIESIEEERRRMALSLHDDMGQSLVALNVEFDLLEKRLLQGGEIDRSRLAEIRKRLGDITSSTRRMSYALHPPMLEELGLVEALQRYIDRFISREGLTVDLEASGFDTKLPRQVSIALYRVLQEALTNVVKHAGASNIVIRLTKGYPRVIMKIEDNGRGFSLKKEPKKDGLGLVGMQERLERLGGDFLIDTNPGEGTRIRVTLPLEV